MKKLFTIIMLLCSVGFAHAKDAEFTDIIKGYKMLERASVSLSACAVVDVELYKLTMPEPSTMTAAELEVLYGEETGHAECLSNIDSVLEHVERDLLLDAVQEVESCTLYLYDLDIATGQQDDHYEVDMWELQDYFKNIDAEEGNNAGLKVCMQNIKQALDYMWEKAYDDYREDGVELPVID